MAEELCNLLLSTNRLGQEKLLLSNGNQYLMDYVPFDISMGIRQLSEGFIHVTNNDHFCFQPASFITTGGVR